MELGSRTLATSASSRDVPALVAAGEIAIADRRFRDAVALLSQANRIDPDPRIERRLVRLRHRAWREVRNATPLPAWPPPVPSQPTGLIGEPDPVPTVAASSLDVDLLRSAILGHGCVLVRSLVEPATASRLRDDIDQAFDARERRRRPAVDPDGGAEAEPADADRSPWYTPLRTFSPGFLVPEGQRGWIAASGGLLAVDSPTTMFDLFEAFAESDLLGVIEAHLGEPPVMSVNKTTLRRSVSAAPSWHQDGSFMGHDVRSVNVWLSLSHCGGDTGTVGLDLVPRRFDEILDTTGHGSMFPHSVGPELVDRLVVDTPLVTPEFHPGDALVFDERFLHRTSVREGLVGVRHAIESWFFAPSSFPESYVPIVC